MMRRARLIAMAAGFILTCNQVCAVDADYGVHLGDLTAPGAFAPILGVSRATVSRIAAGTYALAPEQKTWELTVTSDFAVWHRDREAFEFDMRRWADN